MELKDFNELSKRDFENGAVRNAIRGVFKERDELYKVASQLIETLNMEDLTRKEVWRVEDLRQVLVKKK